MNLDLAPLAPPKRLAVAYARGPQKQALIVLLLFDVMLGGIFYKNSEPILAQLRMAWWRDVIAKAPADRPSGEPLIAHLSGLQMAYPDWNVERRMLGLIDGWDELMTGDIWDDAIIGRHIDARARAIFCGFGAICPRGEGDDLAQLGRDWALSDLRSYCRDGAQMAAIHAFPRVRAGRLPAHIPRALAILERSARDNLSPIALFWHALTGR